MENKAYRVLQYYIYSSIENPEEYRDEHHLFCVETNLLGRVIVSKEGLNGTVSGLAEDCENDMQYMHSDPRFAIIQLKIEHHDSHALHNLHVSVKEVILNSDLPDCLTVLIGKHLSPEEFKKMLN